MQHTPILYYSDSRAGKCFGVTSFGFPLQGVKRNGEPLPCTSGRELLIANATIEDAISLLLLVPDRKFANHRVAVSYINVHIE
jgi:hypothetical protein